jgi:hypothetical protein
VEVEPDGIELRRRRALPPRSEVVVEVRGERPVQGRLDQLQRVGVLELGDHVGEPIPLDSIAAKVRWPGADWVKIG